MNIPDEDYSYKSLYQGMNSLYLIGNALGLLLISLLLGIGILLIFQGLFFSLLRLSAFWEPAFLVMARCARFRALPKAFKPLRLKRWTYIFPILGLIISLLMIGVGIWIIAREGFCGQNLFC